ncbi:hypothetical protein HDV05_008400 [Chytridiales sp. JEL 0842]|nr:hypothetical protein HDV05_008400 [Chytridiales sp. JEL 0842]
MPGKKKFQGGKQKKVKSGASSKTNKWDIYDEDNNDDAEIKKIINRRGRHGLDDMENYEFDVQEVAEEDDEEIDEDEAFIDSDEEQKFAEFFSQQPKQISSKGKKKSSKEFPTLSLNEDSDDAKGGSSDDSDYDSEEDLEAMEDNGDMINLSDLLGTGPSKAIPQASSTSTIEEDPVTKMLLPTKTFDGAVADDDLEEDLYSDTEMLDDDDQELGTSTLADYVSSLGRPEQRKRKRVLAEANEAYTESEFNLTSHISHKKKKAMDFDDLVSTLPSTAKFGSLKKQIEQFDTVGTIKSSKSSELDKGIESAPLAKRIQDKFIREAAYDEANKEVSKWVPLVKKNREADQLVFPMNEAAPAAVTSSGLVAKFQAETSMEQEIASILEMSELSEKKQMELEELEMNKITKEELEARRAELAKMRSLMFYQELKQKKIAKIKSKTYRKIRKKDKEGNEMSIDELKKLDPDAAREKLLKLEAERIKERMNLKHKGTGKWAKRMAGRGADEDVRQALIEQLNKNQELTRKIAGLESDEDEDDYTIPLKQSDSEEDEDEEDSETRHRKAALAALGVVEEEIEAEDKNEKPGKGLFAMKFMQRNLDTQKANARKKLERARQSVEDGVERWSDDESEEEGGEDEEKVFTGRKTFGRKDSDDESESEKEGEAFEHKSTGGAHTVRVSGPVTINMQKEKDKKSMAKVGLKPLFEVEDFEVVNENEKGVFSGRISAIEIAKGAEEKKKVEAEKPTDLKPAPTKKSKQQKPQPEEDQEEPNWTLDASSTASNPWLSSTSGPVKKSAKLSTGSGKDVSRAEKGMEKLTAERKKAAKAQMNELDEGVELVLDGVRDLERATAAPSLPTTDVVEPPAPQPKKKKQQDKKILEEGPSDNDSDDDGGLLESKMVHESDVRNMTQRQVMQIAFAHDNLLAEFEQEKERIVESEKPKDEDLTLPGWGTWAGTGLKDKKNVVVKKAKPGEGINPTKRKDAKLKHVIINEKRMKKAAKYMATEVPFGFESREQYEQTLRLPLGREWNANLAHAKLTAPKVVTKMGKIINPLKLQGSGLGKKKKAASDGKGKK